MAEQQTAPAQQEAPAEKPATYTREELLAARGFGVKRHVIAGALALIDQEREAARRVRPERLTREEMADAIERYGAREVS